MFQIPENRLLYTAYLIFMLIVTVITFENLTEYDFWDGWDDWAVMADMKVMVDDLPYMFSPEREHRDVRPPVDLVFLVGYFLWQDHAVGFRMMQVVLHLLASLLLVYALKRLGVDLELSLMSGLLFLVNVAHFRALHWIMPTNYILAFIFALIVVLCYCRFLGERETRWLGITLFVFLVAIFSHPCAVTAGLFCVYLTYRRAKSAKEFLKIAWPILLAIAAFPLFAYLASPTSSQNEGVLAAISFVRLLENPFWYLGRLMTSAHWVFRDVAGNQVQVWEIVIGFFGFLCLGFLCYRRVFPVQLGTAWVVFSILPFVNNAPERMAVGPSRHLYFASAGAVLILAWGLRTGISKFLHELPKLVQQIAFICLLSLLVLSSIVSLKQAEGLSIYFAGRGYDYKSGAQPEYSKTASRLYEWSLSLAPELAPDDIYLRLVQSGASIGKSYMPQLEDALQENPHDAELRMLKGVTHFLDGDQRIQEKGERILQQAILDAQDQRAIKKNAAIVFRNMAGFFYRSNQFGRAADLYQNALHMRPDYVAAMADFGRVLYQLGNKAESLQTLRKAVQLDSTSGTALQNLGTALFMEGHIEEAILIYRKGMLADSENNAIVFNLALTLVSQGHIVDATSLLEQFTMSAPDDVGGHFLLGRCYEAMKRFEDAIQRYRQVLVLDSGHEEARERLMVLGMDPPKND